MAFGRADFNPRPGRHEFEHCKTEVEIYNVPPVGQLGGMTIESYPDTPPTTATRPPRGFEQKYGLEAAQLMLGHSSAMITDAVYAERDHTKIIAIAGEVG